MVYNFFVKKFAGGGIVNCNNNNNNNNIIIKQNLQLANELHDQLLEN